MTEFLHVRNALWFVCRTVVPSSQGGKDVLHFVPVLLVPASARGLYADLCVNAPMHAHVAGTTKHHNAFRCLLLPGA